MKLIPSTRTVILKPIASQKTAGGLEVMTGTGKNRPELGLVYAIGPGKLPVEIKEGDTVAYRKYMENEIFIRDTDYNFIDFKDILCVVKDDETEAPK